MSNPCNALRDWLSVKFPLARIQLGRWEDQGAEETHIVIKPMGGYSGDYLRRPRIELILIGPLNAPTFALTDMAYVILGAARTETISGLGGVLPSDPFFESAATGRPQCTIDLEVMTT